VKSDKTGEPRRGLDRLVPADFHDRVFVPAREELRQARAERAAAGSRIWPAFRYAIGLLVLALHCYRLSLASWIQSGAWRAIHPFGDIRYALRLLTRQPGFALVAIATLALGIGASTAIFTVVDGVLLKPLPYPSSDRLVQVAERSVRLGVPMTVAPLNFLDWQRDSHSFEGLAAYELRPTTLTDRGESERVTVYRASAGLFAVLHTRASIGRSFTAEEDRANGPRVAILSEALWRRRFGRSPAVLGTTVRFDGVSREIVGVIPQGLAFPSDADAWFPLALDPSEISPNNRGAHYLSVIARLKPSVTAQQAGGEMEAMAGRMAKLYPRTNAGSGVIVRPLVVSMVASARPALLTLLVAVGFLLLIACANVSHLLLARASGRRTEMAMRAALGAGRIRLFTQLLTESVVLACAGGAAGIVFAVWGVDALLALVPENLPRVHDIAVDVRVLGFALALSGGASVAFGLAPALHVIRSDSWGWLKAGHRGAGSSAGRTLRDVLVAGEVALALALLVSAMLSIRSFGRLSRVEPGFNPSGVLTFQLALPASRYPDSRALADFVRRFGDDLAAQPGVRFVSAAMLLPLQDDGFGGTFSIIGQPAPSPDDDNEPNAQIRPVAPAYFRAMEIPILQGRDFTVADRETSAPVALISESVARQYWPGEDPVGRRLRLQVSVADPEKEREIIGVVRDVKDRRIDAPPQPTVYVPHAQYAADTMTFVLKTDLEPTSLLATVSARLKAFDAEMAIAEARTLDASVDRALAPSRFRALLLGLFAVAALILAAVGLYGVVSYSVSQRTQEIGVRMALGAAGRDVLRLVLRQGLAPVFGGVAIGLAAAAAMARLMSSLLFEVSPLDPATFVSVSLALSAVGVVACYIPARRATRTDPVEAIRSE
jgi:putative ABC transport system permease protein